MSLNEDNKTIESTTTVEPQKNQVLKVYDAERETFSYRMPCEVLEIDDEEKINKGTNLKPYHVATVRYLDRKDVIRTRRAITYNVDYFDTIVEEGIENKQQMLLESQKDTDETSPTFGQWFLKLSHLIFSSNNIKDDEFEDDSDDDDAIIALAKERALAKAEAESQESVPTS